MNAEVSFVVEDENEVIVGIAVGSVNGEGFREKLMKNWTPVLRERYPMSLTSMPSNGESGYLEVCLDIPAIMLLLNAIVTFIEYSICRSRTF